MKKYFLIFLIFLIIKCEENKKYNHTNQENNLYFVFTTFRHGARNTFSSVDIFGNNISKPGYLTKYGGLQHFEIGQNYRNRYSNFLNMNFDKNEIYIRSSDVERTIISVEKELEGLFNKTIGRENIEIINGGLLFGNLYHLDYKEHKKMDDYFNSCKKRRLDTDYNQIYKTEIFEILKNCYNYTYLPDIYSFCDAEIAAFFEYTYGDDPENKIGKCGSEYAIKMNNFCYEWYDTFRGWNEYGAYTFYYLFQHLFDYMDKAIKGEGPLKMLMISGHDNSVDKVMDFFNGMNLIPRTHYPHYACNIVFELRKYDNDFYLEIYYNDNLKYNVTLDSFKKILEESKYSNLYNYCGSPSKIFLKKIFRIDNDKNLYFVLIIIALIVVLIIGIIIVCTIILIRKRKKKFIRLNEENTQKKHQSNVLSINDSTKKDDNIEKIDKVEKEEDNHN